ncbi:DNA damage-inducible protein 1 [Babesia microti strain RI]|uniref:DNA damage-inducible protein 1 n=1 Tax=Babesia microti (strain RI) TaxID=1133968 RepID=A0A1N6LWZ3_BABMR|nr:DNA damage-inducible protein 1 [Babesia microti strain RI]SIO73400.1 DNA damage-inducible protein 1 [Babesia microti strain RI]|eukprot:XP_021337501.1 DNA damage-inducible protein 1 [Babesia microti strain RI]
MIRVTVASMDGNFATLYLETDWLLSKVKELIESQLNIPRVQQVISLNGQVICASDDTKISTIGIDTNDLLLAVSRNAPASANLGSIPNPNPSPSAYDVPSTGMQAKANFLEHARSLIARWKLNSEALHLLDDPELADAISTGNENNVAQLLEKKHQNEMKNEMDRLIKVGMAAQNPLTPESQEIIEKYMHKQRIQESLLNSQEYFPESFGDIVMLYINIEINKVGISAFVDTGAQKTVISKKCAEICNISNLIDPRFGGVVHGVGVSKMLGRIHMIEMKINDIFYPISCVVVENSTVDFLLGLDIMRRYKCIIDLPDNSLTIQGNKVYFVNKPKVITLQPTISSGTSTSMGTGMVDLEKEKKIATLCEVLGIGKTQAKQLLEGSNWDVEQAAALSLSLE